MRIVSIEPLNRRKSRVLTDEGPAFALYNGELEAYGLTLDGELDGETYERILREVLCPRAKERMLHLLEASDRTEAELRRRLREGCFPPEAVEAAIDYGKAPPVRGRSALRGELRELSGCLPEPETAGGGACGPGNFPGFGQGVPGGDPDR